MTEQANEPVKLDRKDLRIIALKQEIGDKADQIADLRGELTETIQIANEKIQALIEQVEELKARVPDEEEPVEVPDEEPDSATPAK